MAEQEGSRVWIDQDLCTGDALCEEIAPKVFTLLDDGLAYVRDDDGLFDGTSPERPKGSKGLAKIPAGMFNDVFEAAEECPGLCIFIDDAKGQSVGPYAPES